MKLISNCSPVISKKKEHKNKSNKTEEESAKDKKVG